MNLSLRIEGDAKTTTQFLIDNEYPALWDAPSLHEYAITLRLQDGDETAGYMWGTWSDRMEGALDFHVCVAAPYKGRWLTDDLWVQFKYIATLLGARSLITKPVGDRETRLVAIMLRRLFGFEQFDDGVLHLSIEDDNYGIILKAKGSGSARNSTGPTASQEGPAHRP